MKKIVTIVSLVLTAALMIANISLAEDPSNVGSPQFKVLDSKTMTLKYGFNGASVFDKSTKKWNMLKMTTITRHKVEGFVNQVNDKFALAAGLHSIAVYDYAQHRWIEVKNVTTDDSTGMLKTNIEFTDQYVKVKTLNGPFYKYTAGSGWQKN
jgi:hypothetical protein